MMAGIEEAGRDRSGDDAIGLGLLIGAAVGVAEVLVRMTVGYTAVSRSFLLEAALIYGGIGLGFGLALRAWGRLRGRPPAGASCAAAIAGGFVFVMLGGYVNIYWLPRFMHWKSLAGSGLLLLASALLAWLLRSLLLGLASKSQRRGEARPFWRRPGPAGIALLGLAGLASLPFNADPGRSQDSAVGADRNVILILVDTLRSDHLSLYGYERDTSPKIDAWGQVGIVFERAIAHSSWTKPSTASLLTSLHPSTHRVSGAGSGLPASAEPLAEILSRNGFHTSLFTGNSYVTPVFGFDQGVDYFWGEDQPRLRQLVVGHLLFMAHYRSRAVRALYDGMVAIERQLTGRESLPEGKVRAETITRRFWSWLDGIGNERFFAYLHYVDPHSPYAPGPPYDRHFMPEHITEPWTEGPGSWESLRTYGEKPDGVDQLVALYDGEILYLDHWIGELLRDLERRGLLENTLVLFTSDHGEEFADHGDFGHGNSLFAEQVQVPLIMSLPAGVADQGKRFPHVVRHIDVFPTVLDVLGLPIPPEIAGRSLLPIVRGEEPPHPPRLAFSEVERRVRAVSLQAGNLKVIREIGDFGERTLAFDLDADGGEQQNLADGAPPWRGELVARLEQFQREAAAEAIPELEVQVDEATTERLRALGYVD
jgi:arylsulfatase A-like enzyme